jgi:hypothetical protein
VLQLRFSQNRQGASCLGSKLSHYENLVAMIVVTKCVKHFRNGIENDKDKADLSSIFALQFKARVQKIAQVAYNMSQNHN